MILFQLCKNLVFIGPNMHKNIVVVFKFWGLYCVGACGDFADVAMISSTCIAKTLRWRAREKCRETNESGAPLSNPLLSKKFPNFLSLF